MLSFTLTGSEIVISITGVKGVKIRDINETLSQLDEKTCGTRYQLFDADYISGPNHIYYAASNAQYALTKGLNISNNLSIETLLYATCESQINKAIKILGLSKWTYNVAVAVFSETQDDPLTIEIAESLGEIDDSVLDINLEKFGKLKDIFDISENAIKSVGKEPYEALTSLIIEKGSLIALGR
jgi:KEOPS complex subunit Cgi121